jgi:hypothetical protein
LELDLKTEGEHDLLGSLPIGISVILRKRPFYEADFEINFPDLWASLNYSRKAKALSALQYLMQTVGLSIVSREENHGR